MTPTSLRPLGKRVVTATFFSLIATALPLLNSTAVHAQLLQNPGFEDPAVGTGGLQFFNPGDTIGSGWTVSPAGSSSAVVIDRDFDGASAMWHSPTEGRQYLYIASSVGENTVTQNISLLPNSYTLTFDQADFASVFDTPGGQVTVDLVSLTTSFSVLGGGQVFTTPDLSDYIIQTASFAISTGDVYQLRLTSTAGRAGLVDNFRLTPNVTSATVPEPTSFALLSLAGLPLAAALVRRRRAS